MIGNYILGGRVQAIASLTVSALISLLALPFAYFISGSVVGLITLRKGAAIGLQVLVASLLVLQIFSVLMRVSPQWALIYTFVVWLPVWVSASVLRLSERQGMLLLAAFIFASLPIVTAYIFIDDVSAWWTQWFDARINQTIPSEEAGRYRTLLELTAGMLNTMMTTWAMLNIFMSVLCARWWQSQLFNPGAFQKEFHALQLPAAVLPASAVVFILVFVLADPWQEMLRDILILMTFMYLIQGVASIHLYVAREQLSVLWLGLMYFLLVFFPYTNGFIVCLGMVRVYTGWREKRAGSREKF